MRWGRGERVSNVVLLLGRERPAQVVHERALAVGVLPQPGADGVLELPDRRRAQVHVAGEPAVETPQQVMQLMVDRTLVADPGTSWLEDTRGDGG